MKTLLCILYTLSLFAQDKATYAYWDFHPLHVGGNVIGLGRADITPKHAPQTGSLVFNKANAFVYLLVPMSQSSYFFPRIELNTFAMDWNKNPKFHQTHFHYVQFALTFYSIAVEQWRWIARADYNLDVNHISHPRSYGLFSALLWGSHEMHRQWHCHLGALGYKGMENQMVYPIIGLDFAPHKKWLLQAVFPMTYSIEYAWNKEWRLSLKGRPLKERFRTGRLEPQPRSIFSYSSMGVELNLHFEKFLRLEMEAYVGYNCGGSFYIKDKTGRHPIYTHIHEAPYGGASLNWGL